MAAAPDDLSLFLFLVRLGGGCGCGCRSRPHRSPVLSELASQIVPATHELHRNRVGDGTIVFWCECSSLQSSSIYR